MLKASPKDTNNKDGPVLGLLKEQVGAVELNDGQPAPDIGAHLSEGADTRGLDTETLAPTSKVCGVCNVKDYKYRCPRCSLP